jgi:hypothetical protein
VLARATGLRRWVPPVNLDEGASVPGGFVLHLADELTPSHVSYRLRQRVVLDHVLDRQALHANHLVLVNDACAELVLVISSSIGNASMQTGNLASGLVPISGAFFLPGKPALRLCQPFLILGKIARVAHALPAGKHNHRRDAQVKPDHLGGCGKWLDLFFHQNGDKGAVGAILADGDRTGFGVFGKRAMPTDIQRLLHLRKSESLPIPREGIGGIGCRLLVLLFLESWVLSATCKEIHKSALKMSQGLLKRHARDLCQPGIRVFESGEPSGKVVVGEALSILKIGRLAGQESPVVDETDTAEGLGQGDFLLSSWVESKLVCPLRLLAHPLLALLVLDVLLDDGQGSAPNRAHKIGIRPQGGQLAAQCRKLLPQEPTTSAFDEAYQSVNAKLGVALNQQMHMVMHDLQS